jgi:hypothetical protein
MKTVPLVLLIAALVSAGALGSLRLASASPLPLGWNGAGDGVAPISSPAPTLAATRER